MGTENLALQVSGELPVVLEWVMLASSAFFLSLIDWVSLGMGVRKNHSYPWQFADPAQ